MNNISKQQVLECLYELSDIEFQRRVWIRAEGYEESSITELISQLFDDTGLGDSLEKSGNGTVFSSKIDSILTELSHLIDKIDFNIDIELLLNHSSWTEIRYLAAKAAQLIKSSIEKK